VFKGKLDFQGDLVIGTLKKLLWRNDLLNNLICAIGFS